jgi:predicted RecB family nuclease
MTDDLQEIDGVGPSREDDLNEAGYETYSDLAEADHEELAEEINRLSEDKALSLVVQGQNLADLEEADVEESEAEDGSDEEEAEEIEPEEALDELPDEDELEEELNDLEEDSQAPSEADSDESQNEEAEPEEEEGETDYEVLLDFEGTHEYDTFYHTLIEERCALRRTNRTGVDTYDNLLSSMRAIDVDGEFTVEMTADELNDLHNAVMEQRYSYQGENLIDYMDALRAVETDLNEIRRDLLF